MTKLRRTSPSQSADAAAPTDEVTHADLTSPGTVADPELEEQRAEQAVARERESRQTEITKFEEQRLEQEAERERGLSALDDVPAPADDDVPDRDTPPKS